MIVIKKFLVEFGKYRRNFFESNVVAFAPSMVKNAAQMQPIQGEGVMHRQDSRFISRLTRQTLALILAGGRGSRLYELTQWRAKPAVPFGGKFRIIDFPLSNCLNSGIRRIGVLTQYKAHSLVQHLIRGWSNFNSELGEFMEILPASQRTSDEWYAGTADAVYQNLDIIRSYQPQFVLILAGDHVYKMDYGTMLAFHVENQATMTVSCLTVPVDEARGAFGVMEVDENHRIRAFWEKPQNPPELPHQPGYCLASMGNYIFNTDFLYEQLIVDADKQASSRDFGKDIIPCALNQQQRIFAFPFVDAQTQKPIYWRDVGTLDAFWETNLEMVSVTPELNLYDEEWPILTHQWQLPPAKFMREDGAVGQAINSMVSGGCVVAGSCVRHSLLFSNVQARAHSYLEDAVVLPDVKIGRGTVIKRAIVDRGCIIPDGMEIGTHAESDRQRFRVTDKGVVLVTPDMLGQRLHMIR